MNKYQEALDVFSNLIKSCLNTLEVTEKANLKVDLLQELVNKETPIMVVDSCKVCNIELYKSNGDNYCSNCGQRIKWGKENE